MDQLTQYIEKFKDGLPGLFETVLTSYQDKINSDFADEYDIPEHEYVQSHPLVQLNDKLFEIDKNKQYNFKVNSATIIKPFLKNAHNMSDLHFITMYNGKVYYNIKHVILCMNINNDILQKIYII